MDLKKKPVNNKTSKERDKRPLKKFNSPDRRTPLLSAKKGNMIAITGGIGTGKTYVLDCFEKLGFAVFNADKTIHEMLKKDGKAFELVAKLFPQSATEDGIDRKVVGEEVFKNPEKLKLLESILHPLVREAQVAFIVNVKNTTGKSIIFEVPLLFENKREKNYDYIVCCIAPQNIQKERVLARKNMTEEKFNAILKHQVSDKVRIKGSHFIIKTGRTSLDTFKQVKALVFDESRNKKSGIGHRNNRAIPK